MDKRKARSTDKRQSTQSQGSKKKRGRGIHRLNNDTVRSRSKKPGLHCDGGGLYLRVTPPAGRSWVFRYMLDGKAREMGLGSYPEVTMDLARELAREARATKAIGQDPIEIRDSKLAREQLTAARAVTFRRCAEAYIESRAETWKNAKHKRQWSATLDTYVMPMLGDMAVSAIDRALVVKVLEPIWLAKPETAKRVRGRIEAVLDWAAAREYRTGENPARWKGSLQKLFPSVSRVRSVKHHAALPYAELPAFMSKLMGQAGVGAIALRFTILTAVRTGEAIGATWPEFDLDTAVWTIPARRTKTDREHRIPLSKPARSILKFQHKATNSGSFVFPGPSLTKPLSNMAMLTVIRRMGHTGVTVHGFRSTFRDWVEETTDFAGSVAESALGHVVRDKVEAAYRRGDLFEKRKALMTAWGAFCTTT